MKSIIRVLTLVLPLAFASMAAAANFRTVVIDAGHGGHDNGGQWGRVYEKHLALDTAVRLENNLLSIRGERKFEKKVSEENYLRVERAYGTFSRSFSLPSTVDAEHINAEYRNGVLTVTLPKREESKPRQIKVRAGNGHN